MDHPRPAAYVGQRAARGRVRRASSRLEMHWDVRSRGSGILLSPLARDVVHSMDIAATVGAERLREIMSELVDRSHGRGEALRRNA